MSLDSCPPSFKIVKLGSVDQERNAINAGFQAILRCMRHSGLPDPTGHAGEFLTTPDGVTVEWATLPSGGGVVSVSSGAGIDVDNTDPLNPIVSTTPTLRRTAITFGWDGA